MRRHLSEPEIARLVTLVEEGYSYRVVGDMMHVSPSVVSRAYNRYLELAGYGRRSGQGRRRSTTPRDDRAMIRENRRDPFLVPNVIAHNYRNRQQQQRNISAQTVRNRLQESGIRARRPVRVPMLTVRHRRARLAYAHQHIDWSIRKWNNVLFTDESRFCLYGDDRRPRVWRRVGERFNQNHGRPVVAFNGGSVMVWAGISRYSRTRLHIVRGNLNARRYIDQILRPYVLPVRQRLRRFFLMHDNARPHTAIVTRHFLEDHNISVLRHPPMSPDLNPIEHVWDMMGRRLRQEYPNLQNLAALERALVRIWQTIPQARIRRCINMADRLGAVIEARGGNTRF